MNKTLQVKMLEAKIQANYNDLARLRIQLDNKFSSIKSNLFLTEVLAIGFSFGYTLAPGKVSKRTSYIAALIVFAKLRRFAKQMIKRLAGATIS